MFRSKYWTCSKFADYLRGTPKPKSGTSKEWNDWEKKAEAAHPFRYWLADEGLSKAQNFVNWPKDQVDALVTYWSNRFTGKTHYCVTGLTPGQWHETDERLLHGMFNELVRFVNNDKAWMEYISHSKEYDGILPWYQTTWPFYHLTEFNHPGMGLDYLKWEISLVQDDSWFGIGDWSSEEEIAEARANPTYGKPTHQSVAAKEIMDLYVWWTEIRIFRPDPHNVSGWSAYCDYMRNAYGDIFMAENKTEEERVMCKTALDKSMEIENSYESEDTEMLIRLVKIRKSMWT